MASLMLELDRRWRKMFAALAAGDDVPPALRLRAEGMMEAAVLLEMATVDELVLAMEAAYQSVFKRCMADDFGEDWADFYPFPQIPAMGRRAPVFPSASEVV